MRSRTRSSACARTPKSARHGSTRHSASSEIDEPTSPYYSIRVAEENDDGVGKRFHVVYEESRALVKTLHLREAYDCLIAQFEHVAARGRSDAIYVDAGLVTLDGVVALVPPILPPYLRTLGHRLLERSRPDAADLELCRARARDGPCRRQRACGRPLGRRARSARSHRAAVRREPRGAGRSVASRHRLLPRSSRTRRCFRTRQARRLTYWPRGSSTCPRWEARRSRRSRSSSRMRAVSRSARRRRRRPWACSRTCSPPSQRRNRTSTAGSGYVGGGIDTLAGA